MNDPACCSVVAADRTEQITIVLGESFEQPELQQLLADLRSAMASARSIVIDCNELAFLPTAVVQILIALAQSCASRGIGFTMRGVSETAVTYFRIAGIEYVLVA